MSIEATQMYLIGITIGLIFGIALGMSICQRSTSTKLLRKARANLKAARDNLTTARELNKLYKSTIARKLNY